MRKIFVVLAIFAPVLLGGCASTTQLPLHQRSNHDATIVVIRRYAEPLAINLNITVDGAQAASLANNSHVSFSVPAGVRRLNFNWPLTFTKVEKTLEFKGGETRYFVVTGTSRVTGIYAGVAAGRVTLNVEETSAPRGEQLLQAMAAGS